MTIDPGDIIEQIIDELALGHLGQRLDNFRIERTGPGSLVLDYGTAGRFTLTVTEDPGNRANPVRIGGS